MEVLLWACILRIKGEEPTPSAKQSPRSLVYMERWKLLWEAEAPWMWGEQASDQTAFDEDCLILLIRELFGPTTTCSRNRSYSPFFDCWTILGWICFSFWKPTLVPHPSNFLLESQYATQWWSSGYDASLMRWTREQFSGETLGGQATSLQLRDTARKPTATSRWLSCEKKDVLPCLASNSLAFSWGLPWRKA